MVRLPPLAAGYAYRLSGFLGLFPVFGHETNAILPYPWGMLHIKTVAWTTEERLTFITYIIYGVNALMLIILNLF